MTCNRRHLGLLLSAGLLQPLLMCGCAAAKHAPALTAPEPAGRAGGSRQVAERLVTRRAAIRVRVSDVAAAAGRVEGIVRQAEGVVAESTRTNEDRAQFILRVPVARLEGVLDELAGLGRATERTVTARDVTDDAFDFEARLQNKRALRERLREHLSSTATLQEVLALEEQLARVQTDIDMLEGQLERLRSDVALSNVSLSLERETRLGPLGYVLHGLWSVVRRLFVWD